MKTYGPGLRDHLALVSDLSNATRMLSCSSRLSLQPHACDMNPLLEFVDVPLLHDRTLPAKKAKAGRAMSRLRLGNVRVVLEGMWHIVLEWAFLRVRTLR